MSICYTLVDIKTKEKVELYKGAYTYASDIPDLLYFIQNNMVEQPEACTLVWDLETVYEEDEDTFENPYIDIKADKRNDSNFTFIKSDEINEEFEVITLVRNNLRIRNRTENWQDVVREMLKGK